MQPAGSDPWSDTIETGPRRRPGPADARPRWRRAAVAILAALVVGAWLAGSVLLGDQVPRGTQVAGVDVGGLHRAEARSRLDAVLAARADRPIVLTYHGRGFAIDPRSAGLSYDLDQTVENAVGADRWNPLRLARELTGRSSDVAVVVHIDRTAVAAAVAHLADQVDTPVSQGGVQIRAGRPVMLPPVAGVRVDPRATVAAVVAAYLHTGTAALPVHERQPSWSRTRLRSFVDCGLRAVLSAPIRLRVAGHVLSLDSTQFGPALSYAVRGGRLVPSVDPAVLAHTASLGTRPSSQAVARAVLAVVSNPRWRTLVHGSSVTRFAHR